MAIHGEGREGGVLLVIDSWRGRRTGGPEVTAGFHKGQRKSKSGQICRRRTREETHGVWRIDRQNKLKRGASEEMGRSKEISHFMLTRTKDGLLEKI